MPLVFEQTPRSVLPIPLPDLEPPKPQAGFGETFRAALNIDNSVVSTFKFLSNRETFEPRKGYNPYRDDDLTGYPLSAFSFSRSPEETAHVKLRVDRERMNREVFDRAPWQVELPARLAAGVLDPIVWIPIGGQALRGGNIAKSALKFAVAGAAGEVLTEIPLQATQFERTAAESAGNIAGAALLSGIGGAAIGKWAADAIPGQSKPFAEAGAALENDLSFVDMPLPPQTPAQRALEERLIREEVVAGLPEERGAFFEGERRVGERRRTDEGFFEERRAGVERREAADKRVREERRLAPTFADVPEIKERLEDELFRLEVEAPEVRRGVLEQATGKKSPRSKADLAQAVDLLRQVEFVDTAGGRTVLIGRRDGRRVILSAETADRRVTARRTEAPERRGGERRAEEFRREGERRQTTERRGKDLGRAARAIDEERESTVEFLLSDPYDEKVFQVHLAEAAMRGPEGAGEFLQPLPEQFQDPLKAFRREVGDAVDNAPPKLLEATARGPEGEELKQVYQAASAFNSTKGQIVREGVTEASLGEQASRLTVANGLLTRTVARMFPNLRLETSPFLSSVRTAELLVQTALPRLKNLAGEASDFAVESGQALMRGKYIQVRRLIQEQYQKLREAGEDLGYEEFKAQVSSAMRRADRHNNPFATAAARAIRPHYDEVFQFAQNMGVPGFKGTDPAVVKFAESYLNRVIDRHAVEAIRNADGETFQEMLTRVIGDAQIARDIKDKVEGLSIGRPFEDAIIEVSAARKRQLAVNDTDLEPWLVNDIEQLAELYFRTVGTEAYLLRSGAGTVEGDAFIKAIRDEADVLEQAAATDAERIRISRRAKRDIEDVKHLIARLRHTHLGPSSPVRRVVDNYRKVSVILRLPNVAIASVPDIGRAIMVEGFTRTMASGWAPVLRNFQAAKIARRQLSAMGTAAETEMNHMLNQLTLTGRVGETNILDRAVDGFTRLVGYRAWTDAQKAIAGGAVQSEIMHIASRMAAGKASKKQIAKLGRLGLDANTARRVMSQFDEFGERVDGNMIPNVGRWTDREASELYQAALVKEIDTIIVTPGIGDTPILFDDSLVRAFFQFRAFGLASVQRTILMGVADAKLGNGIQVLEGAISLVALGAFVDVIRRKLSGDERELSTAEMVTRAVDRSGVVGIFSDWAGSANTMSGGLFSELVSGEEAKRQKRTPGFAFATDVFGLPFRDVKNAVDTVHGIGAAATSGEVTRAHLRAARSFVPLSNWWALRWGFDRLQERVEQHYGIPPEVKR